MDKTREVREYDVIIVGAGSGNTILTPDFDEQNVAIVERAAFGGTCLNRGCIPTKIFAYTADTAQTVRHAGRLGIEASLRGVRWGDVVDRVFGRIDPIAIGGHKYREGQDGTTVFGGDGRFIEDKVLAVHYDDAEADYLTAPTIVLATGSSPSVPPILGLDSVDFYTSDTIMRIASPPRRLLILGGGFIAMEMAHVFDALGSEVVVVEALSRLLMREDEAVSELFTELSNERYDCYLSARVDKVHQDLSGEIFMDVTVNGSSRTLRGDALLVATGRVPNSGGMGLESTGVSVDDRGYVLTDEYMRTTQPGIWALGDITNPMLLKHTANAEARVVAHNIAHPDDLEKVDLWPVPHAVFGAPQVAAVGATEQELRQMGVDYVVAVQRYADVAYGWAMEDSAHFCKLLADPMSRQLLGAHIVGPHASMMIQQLVMGMKFGLTVDAMARGMLYVHPALTEVVENALLQL
ncbi:mycothione reductase [Marmoricola sp. URHA0025 HA25]